MNPVVIDTNCLLQIIARKSPYRLVSEDNHFNVLRTTPFPKLNLVTLDEFMQSRIIK